MASTTTWLISQWTNPRDIFTVLLIVGGDVVQLAIAQICAGPVPWLAPVPFSFGWVSYAMTATMAAVGGRPLMPKPELDCLVINAHSGYSRKNCSWVLSRILRDFDHWRPAICDELELRVLERLRSASGPPPDQRAAKQATGTISKLDHASVIRIGLRITVWQCVKADGVGIGDWVYWTGTVVTIIQIAISIIPWAMYDEWFTFLIVSTGSFLAYTSAGLPQWRKEKVDCRKAPPIRRKDIVLTEGNGSKEAVLLLGCDNGMDLEHFAASSRVQAGSVASSVTSILLASFWLSLLVSVAGWQRHTWYLLSIGLIGAIHNLVVVGIARNPEAFGLHLRYQDTIMAQRVMESLWHLEEKHPYAGLALLQEYFPGPLTRREEALWGYARRRAEAQSPQGAFTSSLSSYCEDIPKHGPYQTETDQSCVKSTGAQSSR
ncbi:hypothetical protein BDZ85DRAFT_287387 [Elsinoe ampelina]|uniref:Uncharacterized protein n=1 Tax=Elsinoe ampelina TaxID=302913 RepID=A0A6A6GLB3_9PEZI|nr:hypothetical protein BDZ85DRAFT_287387 [Elsinoe ampelina]